MLTHSLQSYRTLQHRTVYRQSVPYRAAVMFVQFVLLSKRLCMHLGIQFPPHRRKVPSQYRTEFYAQGMANARDGTPHIEVNINISHVFHSL